MYGLSIVNSVFFHVIHFKIVHIYAAVSLSIVKVRSDLCIEIS